MPQLFGAYCPAYRVGFECSKKGKMISKHPEEQSARDAIAQHINYSSYHEQLTTEQKTQLIEEAEIPEWSEVSDVEEVVEGDGRGGGRPAKRARGAPADHEPPRDGGGSAYPREGGARADPRTGGAPGDPRDAGARGVRGDSGGRGGSSSSGVLDANTIATAVAAGVQQVLQQQRAQAESPAPPRPSPSQVPTAALVPFSAQRPSESEVVVPRVVLQMIVDHLGRAGAAAMQGARVASAAAAAFEQERMVIADCASAVERLLHAHWQ